MAQSSTFITLCFIYLSFYSKLLPAQMVPSTISAAPALLPTISTSASPPLASPSPALSPDITPLFPSPSDSGLAPSDSSLPTIPSSPSPPNPDDISSFGPNTMAVSPSGSLPDSSSVSYGTSMMVIMSLGVFWSFHMM